jgi:hypothetical protein
VRYTIFAKNKPNGIKLIIHNRLSPKNGLVLPGNRYMGQESLSPIPKTDTLLPGEKRPSCHSRESGNPARMDARFRGADKAPGIWHSHPLGGLRAGLGRDQSQPGSPRQVEPTQVQKSRYEATNLLRTQDRENERTHHGVRARAISSPGSGQALAVTKVRAGGPCHIEEDLPFSNCDLLEPFQLRRRNWGQS